MALIANRTFPTGATTLTRKSSSNQKLIIGALGAAIILPVLFVPVSAATSDGAFLVHAQDLDNPTPHEAYAGMKGLKRNADGSWSSNAGSGSNTGGGSDGTGGGNAGGGVGGDGSTGGGSTGGGTGSDGGAGSDGGSGANGDGSQGTDGPGSSSDTSEVVGTYTAGPISLRITQAMLDFSAANLKAQEEGRSGDIQTTPNGWKTVWFSDGNDNYSQTPSSITADTTVYLTKSLSAPANWWDPAPGDMNNPDTIAYYDKRGSSVEGGTKLAPETSGTSFYYKKAGGSGGSTLKEGRYISEGGSTIAAWVENNGGGYNVTRTVSASNLMAPRSDTKPYRIDFQNGSATMADMFLKTETDGYDTITVRNNNGSAYVRYGKANGNLAGDNSPDSDNPIRKNGPISISGKVNSFDQIGYTDSNGTAQFLGDGETRYTVDDFNQASGLNWDGKFPVPSDFDVSKPFEPRG